MMLHAQLLTPAPLTLPPPPTLSASTSGSGGSATPAPPPGSSGSTTLSNSGGDNSGSGGGKPNFPSSTGGSGSHWANDGSGSRWSNDGSESRAQSSGSGMWDNVGWESQGGSAGSSSGSGWGNPTGGGWDGLWNFKGGWNWDSPYPPPAGITLETDIDGEVAMMPRRKVFFNPNLGFSASHSSSPSKCMHRFCLRVSISSSYGAMSAFDSFVMDRYESKSDIGSDSFFEGGPIPLVNGMLTQTELSKLYNNNTNESAGSRFNHSRTTSWMLYPLSNDTDEIDVVMSFKQLYTLLPDYNGTDASSDGPFYSDDPNDQVILRVTARLASVYGASTALLPLVVDFKGSRLFDVTYTSMIVYDDEDSYTSNQIALNLVFDRKRYGGFLPWMPVQPSNECRMCDMQMMTSNAIFGECLKAHVGDSVFSDLLSPDNNITSFDLKQTREECFSRLLSMNASSDFPSSSSSSSSASFSQDSFSAGNELFADPSDPVAASDAGVRCFINSQCPIGDSQSYPSDGNMVVFACRDASVRATFTEPEFAFHMDLTVLNETELSTDVIASGFTEKEIAQAVKRAIPAGDRLSITARVFNNSMDIYYANKWNEWLMNEYSREMPSSSYSSESSSSSSFSGSDGSGDAGSPWKPASSVSSDGSMTAEGSLGLSQDGAPQPQRRPNSAASPPQLYEVPAPKFTVEITFGNVSIVPVVTGLFSSQNVSWEYVSLEVGFELAPLNVSKYSYVAPPSYIDLGSDQSQPGSGSGSWGNNISLASLPGSCGECTWQYVTCALDEDCRFGVRTYMYWSLQKVWMPSPSSSVELTWIFRDADSFFPLGGLNKFSAFISCLASRSPVCDVDVPREEMNSTTGLFKQAPPSYLRIEPSRITMSIDRGSTFYIYSGGRSFLYHEDGDSNALRWFLQTNFVWSGSIPNITVNVSPSPDNPNRNFYTVEFEDLLFGTPYFSRTVENPSTDIQHFERRVFVEKQGGSATEFTKLQGLLDWLQPLSFDWGTEANNGSSTGWSSSQPAPTNPDAICSVCMTNLDNCLRDYECSLATRDFLQTYMQQPSLLQSTILQPDGTFHVSFSDILESWRKQVSMQAYGRFLELLNCVSSQHCAVGYSSVAATSIQFPTTVLAGRRATLVVTPASPIEFTFKGWQQLYNDTGSSSDFAYFLWNYAGYGHVNVTLSPTSDGRNRYEIFVDQVNNEFPLFLDSPTTQVVSQETITMFVSAGPNVPTWNNLLQWFGIPSNGGGSQSGIATTPDVCTECIPNIMECLNDLICSAAVRDYFVPELRQVQVNPLASGAFNATFDGQNSTTFTLDLSNMLSRLLYNTEMISAPSSWSRMSRALLCLADRPCDLEYMSAATAPPATAHAPTYLKFQGGSADIVLLEGTSLNVYFPGQQLSFVQPADDSTAFVTWLTQLMEARTAVYFSTTDKNPDTGEFRYAIDFKGYIGTMPEFSVSNIGDDPISPTASIRYPRLWFESVNQGPKWQKLIDYLSIAPFTSGTGIPTTAPPSTSVYQCPDCIAALNNCFSDAACLSMLLTYAVPNFRSIPPPELNTVGRYESDYTGMMTWNVLAMTGSDTSRSLLMEVFKCSAASSCLDVSSSLAYPGSNANLILQYPTGVFSISPGAQMTITFEGNTQLFQDSADTNVLKSLLEDTVLFNRGIHVEVQRYVDENNMVQYHFVYNDMYSFTLPHFSWQSPDGPDAPRSDSTETGWRFVFSSTVSDLQASFRWWVEWLATNGNPVKISM